MLTLEACREGWLFTFGTLRRGRTEMGDECMLRGGFVGGIFTFGALRREGARMEMVVEMEYMSVC